MPTRAASNVSDPPTATGVTVTCDNTVLRGTRDLQAISAMPLLTAVRVTLTARTATPDG